MEVLGQVSVSAPSDPPCSCCTQSPLTWPLRALISRGSSNCESLPLGLISPDDNRTNTTHPGAIPFQLSLSLKTCPSYYMTSGFFDTTRLFSYPLNSVSSYSSPPKPRWREEGLGTELELCQMTNPAFPTPFPNTDLLGLIPSGVSEPVCKAEFCVSSPKL